MASLHEHDDDEEPGREYVGETSAQWMLLKMKTRSMEESGGSSTPSMPSVGRTQKPTHGTHLTAEISMVSSLQPMIASTTRQSGTSLKQLC
jgi:hypothetical protein